jgi:lipopolysaccharide transport system ATP-binding protein
MSEELAISLRGVSKCFKRYDRPIDRLKELLIPGKSRAQEFWALRDMDLDVPKGQTLGIVGRNGSGKSTLLQIIAGTLTPTTGTVQVNGRVSALLELGSGFNPEFTGRQNVFFNGQLLGLTKAEVEERFDTIAAFADIGDFIDQPVKTYSSGMFVRLGFAVAVHVDPEILVVDEALAVGDIFFQQKCFSRIRRLRESNVNLLFVSHDSSSIYKLCNKAILLEQGQILLDGSPKNVIYSYESRVLRDLNDRNEKIDIPQEDQNARNQNNTESCYEDLNYRSSLAESSSKSLDPIIIDDRVDLEENILNVSLLTSDIKLLSVKFIHPETRALLFAIPSSSYATLAVSLLFHREFEDPHVGFRVCNRLGEVIYETHTFFLGHNIGLVNPFSILDVEFNFALPLSTGDYTITIGVADTYIGSGLFKNYLEYKNDALTFKIIPSQISSQWSGIINLDPKVNSIQKGKAHV